MSNAYWRERLEVGATLDSYCKGGGKLIEKMMCTGNSYLLVKTGENLNKAAAFLPKMADSSSYFRRVSTRLLERENVS